MIANHALLLSDLASRSRVLPDYDVLIVDEAHHLEDEATQQLGWRLGERELLNRLERLWSLGQSAAAGRYPRPLALIRVERFAAARRAAADCWNAASRPALQLGSAIRRFFEGLVRLLDDPELLAGGDDSGAARHPRRSRRVRLAGARTPVGGSGRARSSSVERAIVEVTAELEALPGRPTRRATWRPS